MSYEIEVRTLEAQPLLFITRRCAPPELGQALGEILPVAFRYALEQGQQPVGPPLMRYREHDIEAGQFVIEGGCPIAAPVEVEGDLEMGELPAGEVAFTWHVGPYDQLGDAHSALIAWIGANGREAAGAPWDVYWTDPSQEPDPSRWRTEVLMPIK